MCACVRGPDGGSGQKKKKNKNAVDACVCVLAHVYNFPLGIACRRLRAHLARETRPLGVSAAAALAAHSRVRRPYITM